MLNFGLTGGIGCGKSTVSAFFRAAGIPVVDADQLGHRLLEPTSPLVGAVRARFPECASRNGGIDRNLLAKVVFDDPALRDWLENLLHPRIFTSFMQQMARLPEPQPPACILEAALLLESRFHMPLAGLIVVTAPLPMRIERLRLRDGMSDADIRSRLAAQWDASIKAAQATYLVDNSGTLEYTRRRVQDVVRCLTREQGGDA